MDHLKHQKRKNKLLENNFKPINKCINDMEKFEKRDLIEKRIFTKTLDMVGTIG